MSETTSHMSSFPKRVPGAHLRKPSTAPEGGWFGTPDKWPRDDPDAVNTAAAVRHLNRLLTRPDTESVLRRVIDGLHRLDPDP